MHDTITVNGSHGSIEVHRTSGHVITADTCDCRDCAEFGDYRQIKWFDPARWDECALKYGETDILCTAHVFQMPDGSFRYEREATVVSCGDPELPDYYLDFVLFLPSPE